jgi:hypothetical protein
MKGNVKGLIQVKLEVAVEVKSRSLVRSPLRNFDIETDGM